MFVKILIFLNSIIIIQNQILPCPEHLTVNITDGIRIGDDKIIKDNITYYKSHYYHVNSSTLGCVCNIKNCIRKCCGPEELVNTDNKKCVKTNQINFTYQIHDGNTPINSKGDYHLIYNEKCEFGRFLLMPHYDETDKFYLQKNGSLYLPNYTDKKMYHAEHYCLDNFQFGNETFYTALACSVGEMTDGAPPVVYSYGMIISMPFLLATFIVYALLPERNLHMKALMSYVISLFFGYLLLVIIQLSSMDNPSCTLIGYFCLFFFLVSFYWMNVICVDIWFGFSGIRGFTGNKNGERKRFLLYCTYTWGMSVLHILTTLIIQKTASKSSWFTPDIGEGQCFLKRGYPELLYLYLPMSILITINTILFILTAFKIRSIKKDTSMLKKSDSQRHTYENDKQKFNLYLKLLLAMGVNWTFEIISWIINKVGDVPPYVWYFTDSCNAIYGVVIFFIFVFKKSIWRLLKKRYYSFIGKTYVAHSMTQNQTRVTSYSTNSTSLHEHNPTSTTTVNENAILTTSA